jgi:iron(III) transport system substrate-binding protein
MNGRPPQARKDRWFTDPLACGTSAWPYFVVLGTLLLTALAWSIHGWLKGDQRSPNEVVVYAAQDQVYAEPILRQFERETGIRVRAVYDSEAVKTVGLANRLVVEQSHPQCDVFWGNEELRTRQLAARGVFRESDGWRAFGHRSRKLVVNTNLVSQAAPVSLLELTNAVWRGRVALAYPLFGTTATHFLALRQQWGEAGWLSWCHALQANRPLVVDGNSVVVKLVGRGEAWVGLTDSDDIAAGRREGLPVRAVDIAEPFPIPNTAGITRHAPHPIPAQRLLDYLGSAAVVQQLVAVGALEGIEQAHAGSWSPNWDDLLRELETGTTKLKEVFLR